MPRNLSLVIVGVLMLLSGCGMRSLRLIVDKAEVGQVRWGTPVSGLQSGLEVTMSGEKTTFVGHLKNVSDAPIKLIDPKMTGRVWGVATSSLDEQLDGRAQPAMSSGFDASAIITLAPGEERKFNLPYRINSDEAPYTAKLRYVYANYAQSTLATDGTSISQMWIGRAISGEVPIGTDFRNSKPNRGNRGI